MRAQIKLGRIFGVQIGLHYSWFFIAYLITLSLSAQFRNTNPEWGTSTIWTLAVAAGLLFFIAILLHELSHAVVAKAYGLPVHSITLFALGGVAQIEKESGSAKAEFWMGIAGPIASILIGLLFLGLAATLGWRPMEQPARPLWAMLVWLGYINITLAIFNLIPGFPLDGGRVLRSIVWWKTGNVQQATRIAARIGQFVAFLFIAVGLLGFFTTGGFGRLWIALIGWFLLEAARASYQEVEVQAGLRNIRVSDVMSRDCPTIDAQLNLQQFVDDHLVTTGRRCFLATQNDQVVGLITPQEVKQVERTRWPETRVKDVMRPLETLRKVKTTTPISEALQIMSREDVNQLPVMSNGKVEGMLSRSQVLALLQTRAELHM
ncbi:site-2 protease family protein [bacterium]|nr:site-2 protease family protein [bacterium]MCI0601563.1 site-2 protease family protein [bacterium]